MIFTLGNLKDHLEAYLQPKLATLDGAYHSAIRDFVAFVEGRQAEQDALDLLTKLGYTINQPLPPVQ